MRYSGGITEGSSRMVEIIDSMLDVSRIDTNQLDLQLENIQIEPVIEKVKKAFASAFEERNIVFLTTGLVDLPIICGDKDLLYKVFYHVIGNAIKYTSDRGKIIVSGRKILDATPPEIEISIQDTGIGID